MAEAFHFNDGTTSTTPAELLAALERDRKFFDTHVGEGRNDFADWLDYIGQASLAKALRDSRTYEETVAAIRHAERGQHMVYHERPLAAFFLGIAVGVLLSLIIWALLGALL